MLERLPEFSLAMTKLCRLAKRIIDAPPPDPASLDPRELLNLGRLARAMSDDPTELRWLNYKLLTMSAVDFLDLWFESAVLKAPMSVSGIIGTFLGVRSPGTAYVLLHHYMGEIDGAYRAWGFSKGGTGQREPGDRQRRARLRRGDRRAGAGREGPGPRRATTPPVWCSRTATRSRPAPCSRASTRTVRS